MPRPDDAARGRSVRVFCLALLGVLLMQSAWALVVPPFRGLDEHEHVFKAAAVARGDWRAAHEAAPGGWGELLVVPTDIAQAARPVCEKLKYVKGNCEPRPTDQPGMSQVGSSATRYNPVFYAVIGTAALPFDGTAALYAMRAAAALMCALTLAFAFTLVRSWSRSSWMPAAFLLAATPVTLYSTAIAAPNGLELSAAFLIWCALLGVTQLPAGDPRVDRLLVGAAVGAVPLAVVRTLGPLWLVLIVATCALLTTREQRQWLLRSRRLRVVAVAVTVLGSFGPIWALMARTNTVTSVGERFDGVWGDLPGQWVLWFLQSVAAFPSRDEIAPMPLYAIALVSMWLIVAVAWKVAARRERLTLVMIVVASSVVACGITVATYPVAGPLWQGRYGYPYAAGFLLLCGVVLDRRLARGRLPLAGLLGVAAVTVSIELIGLLHVLHKQLAISPLAGTSAWPAPPVLGVVALVALSVAALVLAALRPVSSTGVVLSGHADHRSAEVPDSPEPRVSTFLG